MRHLLFFEHIRTAQESLRRTRMRTGLTVLGIAIGVASITAILALSSGVSGILRTQTEELGDNIALVRPAAKQVSITDISNPLPSTSYATSPITERDLKDVSKLPGVEQIAPLMTLSGSVHSSTDRPKVATILATTPNFTETTPITMHSGEFLSEETNSTTAIIGEQLSIDLFGTIDSIGKTLSIKGQTFTCIGVMKRQNNPINYNLIDLDSAVIIRFDSGKLFNNNTAQIQQLNVKVKPGANAATLASSIDTLLKKNHDGAVDTNVLTGKQVTAPVSQQFAVVQIIMMFIAGISLLVGGIGIMNIMLVSVTERTREIGLRKAVGATSLSIVVQFMIEALIASFLGGLIGYTAGYAFAWIIGLFLPYNPGFSWLIVIIAAVLSLGVGLIFGLSPAVRAARKNPIESLRKLH